MGWNILYLYFDDLVTSPCFLIKFKDIWLGIYFSIFSGHASVWFVCSLILGRFSQCLHDVPWHFRASNQITSNKQSEKQFKWFRNASWYEIVYCLRRNFSKDLILALLVRLFSSLKLCIANNAFRSKIVETSTNCNGHRYRCSPNIPPSLNGSHSLFLVGMHVLM